MEGNIVTIQVYPQLNAGTISAPADICYNANTVISSTAAASGGNTNDGYAYQWQKYNGSAWENIDDEYGLSYTTPNLTQTTSYRRTVENTCGDKTTNEITINVYDALQAGTIARLRPFAQEQRRQRLMEVRLPAAMAVIPICGSKVLSVQAAAG